MWLWETIKDIMYSLFVEVWVNGLIVVTLLTYFGSALFESFVGNGHLFIGILALLIFAAAVIYIIYWYFANGHFILGIAAVLVCLAVVYQAFIEPYI